MRQKKVLKNKKYFEEAKSFVITDFLAEKNKKNQDDYLASLKEKYNVVIESDR